MVCPCFSFLEAAKPVDRSVRTVDVGRTASNFNAGKVVAGRTQEEKPLVDARGDSSASAPSQEVKAALAAPKAVAAAAAAGTVVSIDLPLSQPSKTKATPPQFVVETIQDTDVDIPEEPPAISATSCVVAHGSVKVRPPASVPCKPAPADMGPKPPTAAPAVLVAASERLRSMPTPGSGLSAPSSTRAAPHPGANGTFLPSNGNSVQAYPAGVAGLQPFSASATAAMPVHSWKGLLLREESGLVVEEFENEVNSASEDDDEDVNDRRLSNGAGTSLLASSALQGGLARATSVTNLHRSPATLH